MSYQGFAYTEWGIGLLHRFRYQTTHPRWPVISWPDHLWWSELGHREPEPVHHGLPHEPRGDPPAPQHVGQSMGSRRPSQPPSPDSGWQGQSRAGAPARPPCRPSPRSSWRAWGGAWTARSVKYWSHTLILRHCVIQSHIDCVSRPQIILVCCVVIWIKIE